MKKHPPLLVFIILIFVWTRVYPQAERMRPKSYEIIGAIKVNRKELPRRIILEEKGSLIFSGKWGGSLSHNFYTVKARGLPADYRANYMDTQPEDHLQTYALRALRNFSLFNEKLRLGVECGLTWMHYKSADFTFVEHLPQNLYRVTYKAKNFVGLSLRVRSDIQLSSMAGLELAVVSDINPVHFFVGCELFLTGRLVKSKSRYLNQKNKK